MRKRRGLKIIIILILILVLLVVVSRRRQNRISPIQPPTANEFFENDNPSHLTPPPSISFDCTLSNCPRINIVGDDFDRAPNGDLSRFRGFADPSMRKDPASGRIWLAYSWPNIHYLGSRKQVPSVDIHLSYSDDGGENWAYDKPLWPSTPTVNKGGDGGPGYLDHEVVNLLPIANTNGSVTWYGVRLDYFIPEVGGFKERPPNSFQLKISEASSPRGLTDAESATLGAAFTHPDWGVDQDLSKLDRDVKNCMFWNEPTLYFENNTLYLAMRCMADSAIDVTKNNIVVFSTNPTGSVKNWNWKYVGILAGTNEAKELGAPGLTQIDIVKSKDNKILLVTTPDVYSRTLGDFIHYGCKVVEIESISSPKLARDNDGKLIVHASITATDQSAIGPAACTYDPHSDTGILMTRREKNQGFMVATIHVTGIKP